MHKKQSVGRRAACVGTFVAALALIVAPHLAGAACKVQAFEIPVRMVDARPIANVSLNGIEVPMLVDSGAFFSLLTESTATQLDLPRLALPDNLRITGYTGTLDASLTRVSNVGFNGIALSNIEFIVGVNELGAGIIGVLGRNFLSLADTEYDLAHGVVRLVFPKGDCDKVNLAYWAGDAPVNEVPLETERGETAIRVTARLNGKNVSAMLDTGAPQTSLTLRGARRAGIEEADMVSGGRVGGAGAGHAKSWVAHLAVFELGGEKITGNRLEVDDVSGNQDMLLGLDYFLSHRIYVSRLQDKLYATWNGGPVFARNKADAAGEANYAAAPRPLAADDADALVRRGEAALARRDYTRALQDLDRACALAPQSAGNFLSRARVHLAMKHADKALKDLDESLRLDASLDQARALRASLQAAPGRDRQAALDDLKALDATLLPSSQLRISMAAAYARLDLAPEALHQWDLWMPSHRNDVGLASELNNRCWLRARLKLDLARALEDCKEAVRLDRGNASYHDSLGWTYLRLDDMERAIKSFDRSIELRALSPWSLYGRALAQRRRGDADSFGRDLAAARVLTPSIDAEVREAGYDAVDAPAAALSAAQPPS